ncbi:MAG: hypothetical protein AAFZ18_36595 [Myxococcota bacterium]
MSPESSQVTPASSKVDSDEDDVELEDTLRSPRPDLSEDEEITDVSRVRPSELRGAEGDQEDSEE